MIFPRDLLHRVVCNIRIPLANGNEEMGTGIFVQKQDGLLLLTAAHVVRNHNTQTAIIICDDSGNATRLPLSLFIGSNQWSHHSIADLAYIRLVETGSNNAYLANRFFPFDHINLQNQPISRDLELTSIGFPLGLGAAGRFSPLSFRTFAASSLITLPRFDTGNPSDFFILENPGVGGYSGAPIFDLGYLISGLMTQSKEATICYGFIHGTISDATGGKLAAVTPSSYISGWL